MMVYPRGRALSKILNVKIYQSIDGYRDIKTLVGLCNNYCWVPLL